MLWVRLWVGKSSTDLSLNSQIWIQFTVAPPQHRLYFLPEPQGHGSFRQLWERCCIAENHFAQARPSAPRPAWISFTLQALIWIAAIWWLAEQET